MQAVALLQIRAAWQGKNKEMVLLAWIKNIIIVPRDFSAT